MLHSPHQIKAATALTAKLGISRLAAELLVTAAIHQFATQCPEYWDEDRQDLTDEGHAEAKALLAFLATGQIDRFPAEVLDAIGHAAKFSREYTAARDALVNLAMTNKSIGRDAIAAGAGVTPGRLHQIRTANRKRPTFNALDHIDLTAADANAGTLIGFTDAGEPVRIMMPEISGAVVGLRPSAKTNLLHLLTLQTARCPNALVWHSDTNNAGLSTAWLHQFACGEVDQPLVDWVAREVSETIVMLDDAYQVLSQRRMRLNGRLFDRGIDRLDVDTEFPEIFIIIDEFADLMSIATANEQQRIVKLITDIRRLNSMGGRVLLSTLRPTGDFLPEPLRKTEAFRAAGKVDDDRELAFMFRNGWKHRLSSDDLIEPGEMFIETPTMDVTKAQTLLVSPEHIRTATTELQTVRAGTGLSRDEAAVTYGYAGRWQRQRAMDLLKGLAG